MDIRIPKSLLIYGMRGERVDKLTVTLLIAKKIHFIGLTN